MQRGALIASLDGLECIRKKWKFPNKVGLWCFVVREKHWHVSKSQILWNPFPKKFCKQKSAKRIKAQLFLVETLTPLEVWSQIWNSFCSCAAKQFRYALPRLLIQQSKYSTYFNPFFHYDRENESSECDLCFQIMKSEQRHFSAVSLLQQQELECTAVMSCSIFSNDMSNKFLFLQRLPFSEALSASGPLSPTTLLITKMVLCIALGFSPLS